MTKKLDPDRALCSNKHPWKKYRKKNSQGNWICSECHRESAKYHSRQKAQMILMTPEKMLDEIDKYVQWLRNSNEWEASFILAEAADELGKTLLK